MIKLYNTLSKSKETFKSLKKGTVGLYTCGPTVYDYAHTGNLRTFIFEDILKRTLQQSGYKVKHIMNITDVDDKTIAGAKKESVDLKTFTKKYEQLFKVDLKKLNVEPPVKYTRATEHIPAMIKIIRQLLSKKIAYRAEDGIYFNISKFKKYGKLSGLRKRKLKAGVCVSADEYAKDSPQDFVLWKAAKIGEPSWKANFGRPAHGKAVGEVRPLRGRPGWHIECSAMSAKYLGQPFDIHAGGVDLVFPHHENEIAQSEAAYGKTFVKYWVHGEHLLVEGQKMSKSLGNILTLRDLEAKGFNPLAFRYLTLTAHYRSQMNFVWESLKSAQNSLERLREFVLNLKVKTSPPHPLSFVRRGGKKREITSLQEVMSDFTSAIFDDLDTPKAIAVMWKLIHKYNKNPENFDQKAILKLFLEFDKVLGLGINLIKPIKTTPEVARLIAMREEYRKKKDWKKADELRKQLAGAGYGVQDSPGGPIPHVLHQNK